MANPLEAQLHYPLGDRLPEAGETIEVAPGVRWLRMALPFALDHINLWLLRDAQDGREGWTVVDCGIANEPTRVAWEQVFETQLGGLPVQRVIVTHMHPDHVGLAHWLTERWRCRLWMSAADWQTARAASASTTDLGGEPAAAFFESHGLRDPGALDKVKRRANDYASMVPEVPAAYRRLIGGQSVEIGGRAWALHAGYGHAPEHIALHSEDVGVLISGDMVLPRISTNVSVYESEPEGDALSLYLESIGRMRALPEGTLVLPSHGKPFVGLRARIAQLEAHHDERLADVMKACTEAPMSAADVLPVLFKRSLDLHQTTFAMGEAIAHLHRLWHGGRLRRERGADGVWRFGAPRLAPSPASGRGLG